MELLFTLITGLMSDLPTYLNAALTVFVAFGTLLGALIALFMLIPGEHPDKELTWLSTRLTKLVEWITKYSRK